MGRRLLLDGHVSDAETIFEALGEWSAAMSHNDDARVLVVRRLAACRRAANDFAGAAALLDGLGEVDAMAGPLAALETERGLIEAGIERLTDIRFPRNDERRIALMDCLAKGRAHFEMAFEIDAARPHAAYCLGMLALCEDRTRDAARFLEAAESGMRNDTIFEESGLRADTTFHRAAAMLAAGEIGREDAAFASMNEALDAGCRPSPKLVVEAATALADAGAPSLTRFISRALDLRMSPAPLVPLVCSPARQGDRAATELALRMGGLGRLGNLERMECLLAAFEGSYLLDQSAAEEVIDSIEDLLRSACSEVVDDRWAQELEQNDQLRSLVSPPTADLLRADICLRLGRKDEAVGIVGSLARRAANDALDGYSVDDLLGRLEEMGATETELSACRSAMPAGGPVGAVGPPCSDKSVSVVFVGGDERQAQYDAAVVAAIAERYGESVKVEFIHPGWGSNWARVAERVEASYLQADAVVLMPLVRTNFGRRIRRTSGEAGLPWVACTGHGRAAIERAICRAVDVARTA